MSQPVTPPAATVSPAPEVEEGTKRGTTTRTTPTRAQAQVARRAAEARATVPSWSAAVDVDLTAALAVADAGAAGDEDVRAEPVDLVARAVGLAVRAHPRLNGTWRDGRIETWSRVNVGVLTDVDGGANLVAATVYDVDVATLAQVAAARRSVQERAATGALTAPDTAAQTFVLADAGPDGPDRFDAVAPPGVGSAIAVGAVRRRPWVVDGAVVARPVVTLTLGADHRLVHPVHGAAFLGDVRRLLEDGGALAG